MSFSNFNLISAFPDARDTNFSWENHNKQFKDSNIIINATAKNINYPEHWGPLSIKTAEGKEYYKLNHCTYAVDDKRYLIVNNGTAYSSFIASEKTVKSFTINFAPGFVREVVSGLFNKEEFLLENFFLADKEFNFYEKLYLHDNCVSPLIYKLKLLSHNFQSNLLYIEELYHFLLVCIVHKQIEIEKDILKIKATKTATKKELYKRLNRVKDYIDSCYHEDLTLAELAKVCLLNHTYLLRQFKNYFKITPRQYIIQKRMEEARAHLESQCDLSITDICIRVGYYDLASFSKLFKHFYGYSPESYRLLLKEKLR